jgi:hypothetical protein
MKSMARKSLLLCGRGAGKSFICAVMALLTLLQGKNVLLGGQRYDTLHDTLFAEIKAMANDWGIYDKIIWRESPMMMTFGDAHVYFGTYAAKEAVRGYSNVELMILDELFLADMDIFAIWGPVMRGPKVTNPRIIGATTPRPGSLWNVMFSDPECDWEVIRAVTRDNTFITEEQFQLIVSNIQDDAMYRSEILGELITDLGGSAIIHLGDFPAQPVPTSDQRVIAGFDAAEGVERDASAFVKRRGNEILECWKINNINHEEAVRRIRESNKRLKIDKLNMDAAFSDYEYNILKYELPCEQVNFARAATELNKDKYANVRAEMYFNLAWHIKHGLCVDGFELSPEIKRQLCAIGWLHNNQGRLLLTKKDDLRAALKMSTDIADALALTCLNKYTLDDPVMKANRESNQARIQRFRHLMG